MSYSNNYLRVLKTLHKRNIKCVWFKDRRYYGECEDNVIGVNPHSGEILATICHECLHYIYPELDEDAILVAEDHLVKSLTLEQAVEIITIFARKARK